MQDSCRIAIAGLGTVEVGQGQRLHLGEDLCAQVGQEALPNRANQGDLSDLGDEPHDIDAQKQEHRAIQARDIAVSDKNIDGAPDQSWSGGLHTRANRNQKQRGQKLGAKRAQVSEQPAQHCAAIFRALITCYW